MPPNTPVRFIRNVAGAISNAWNRVILEDDLGNPINVLNPLPIGGGVADDDPVAGNPVVIGALVDETATNPADEGDIGFLRMTMDRLLRIVDSREPEPIALHRTISGLWGLQPPWPADANWSANPGNRSKARFVTELTIRGCTGLPDDPIITFRPYVRVIDPAGYVGACETISYTRSRLKDLSSIKCQKTVNNGGAYTDYSALVIDNNVATYADLDALDTVANGDWMVIGGPVPFIGAALDMTANVNTNNSVMTVEYWTGVAWAAVTGFTDGSIVAAGKTLSGDGQISWNLPAVWVPVTLGGISAYYVRVSVSAALSATVEIAEIDLLMPVRAAIDVQADGDDAILTLASQDAPVSGTVAYSGTIYLSWR